MSEQTEKQDGAEMAPETEENESGEFSIIELLEETKHELERIIGRHQLYKDQREELESPRRELKNLKLDFEKKEKKLTLVMEESKRKKKENAALTSEARELREKIIELYKEIDRLKELAKKEKAERYHLLQLVKTAIQESEKPSDLCNPDSGHETEKKEKKFKALICTKERGPGTIAIIAALENDFPDIDFREYEVKVGSTTVPEADVYLFTMGLEHTHINFLKKKISDGKILRITNPEQASEAVGNWFHTTVSV